MKEKLILFMLPTLVKSLLNMFDIEDIRIYLDKRITELEDHITNTPNKVDDALLPVIKSIRQILNIPHEV